MFLKGELIHSRIHLWKTSFAINSTPSTLTMLMRSVLCRRLAKPLCCVQTWCWNLWIHFPILHSENTAKQNSQNTQEKKMVPEKAQARIHTWVTFNNCFLPPPPKPWTHTDSTIWLWGAASGFRFLQAELHVNFSKKTFTKWSFTPSTANILKALLNT